MLTPCPVLSATLLRIYLHYTEEGGGENEEENKKLKDFNSMLKERTKHVVTHFEESHKRAIQM